MKKPENPFVLQEYYGKKWFCDRDTELNTLREHEENGRNTVIYAWRRMGKTALIRCLFDQAKRWRKGGAAESVYIDLLSTQNMDEAINSIAQAVHRTYGRTRSGLTPAIQKLLSAIGVTIKFDPISGLPELSFGLKSPVTPERSLEAVGQFLSERKKRMIVAIDEFQQVGLYKEKNAEAVFRSWMQQFPNIRFIYSGSHRGMMEAMFTEKKRPFYRSAQLMLLSPIERDIYTRFICRHFSGAKKTIDTDVIHRIYGWARGQTYTVQRVCNYLYGSYSQVTEREFLAVTDRILDQDAPVFASYQKLLPEMQWNVLRAVAKEEPLQNPTAQDFVREHRLGASSSVSTALNALLKKELVIHDERGYLVHDVLLSRWLKRL